ncbi:MAG: NAD-dependent epimerase/dehydratase family protein [Candidatus Nitrosocaldaceae archaeon]
MSVLVTGGAGFIGSRLVMKLLSEGTDVDIIDDLSSGDPNFISYIIKQHSNVRFYKLNLLDNIELKDYDIVYHLAANPEVRIGVSEPKIHVEQNIIATFKLLEEIRKHDIERVVFTSSSTVYGDALIIPTPEDYAPLEPISIYGASKLACEAIISSYAHTYGLKALILRLANIIGENSNHGVIIDFMKRLKNNPKRLEVLGDGTQNKSYLYVEDCIDAMQYAIKSNKTVDFFNIGSEDSILVSDIAKIVIEELRLNNTEIVFTGGYQGRGWKGDVKNMRLDVSKIKALGWKPNYNSLEAVKYTVRRLAKSFK